MLHKCPKSGLSRVRQLAGCAVALAFLLTVLPVPIPVTVSGLSQKDLSQPFPCQNRTCGCCSADQCWKQCCCFTNRQKVTWAAKNNIKPPQFVVDAAAEETGTSAEVSEDSAVDLATEICSLPTTHQDPLLLEEANSDEHSSVKASMLSATRPQAELIAGLLGKFVRIVEQFASESSSVAALASNSVKATETGTRFESHVQLVLVIKAMECHGQDGHWIVCAPCAMPIVVCVNSASEPPFYFLRSFSERLKRGSLSPPVPPPRIS